MKIHSVAVWLLAGVVLAGCERAAEAPATAGDRAAAALDLNGEGAQASYGLGYTVGANVRDQFGELLESEAFLAGVGDAMGDAPSQITDEQAQVAMAGLLQRQQAGAALDADANLAAGEAFLAENGAREGVVTTESGLQYEVITAAEGAKPGPTDRVTTHYHGTFIDGSVFDSSVDRGQPATFALNQVIPGWTEGLQLMSVGAKWRFVVPSELAYGAPGRPGIPPNSTLIFEVELISIGG